MFYSIGGWDGVGNGNDASCLLYVICFLFNSKCILKNDIAYLNTIESIKMGDQQWTMWTNKLQNAKCCHRSTVINEYGIIVVTGFDSFCLFFKLY